MYVAYVCVEWLRRLNIIHTGESRSPLLRMATTYFVWILPTSYGYYLLRMDTYFVWIPTSYGYCLIRMDTIYFNKVYVGMDWKKSWNILKIIKIIEFAIKTCYFTWNN